MSIVSKILQFVPVKKPQTEPVQAVQALDISASPIAPAVESEKPAPKQKRPYKTAKRRKDGRFAKSWTYRNLQGVKRRKTSYGNTQAEARAKLEQFKADLAAQLDAAKPSNTLVSTWADGFLDTYRHNITSNTRILYTLIINRIKEAFGSKRLNEVMMDDCQRLMNSCEGYSSSYINKHWSILRSMFEKARQNHIILDNPTDGVTRPTGTKGTHQHIETTDRNVIMDTLTRHPFGAVVMLMLYFGLRRGEALAFNFDTDIDWTNMRLYIRRALRFDILTGQPTIVPPKTNAGVRSIPIIPELVPLLRGFKGVAITGENGDIITRLEFLRVWRKYLKFLRQNGVITAVRCHDFRHTFCTMLFMSGVKLKTAQIWMGHANVQMTLNIYTHYTKEQEVEDVNVLNEWYKARAA